MFLHALNTVVLTCTSPRQTCRPKHTANYTVSSFLVKISEQKSFSKHFIQFSAIYFKIHYPAPESIQTLRIVANYFKQF